MDARLRNLVLLALFPAIAAGCAQTPPKPEFHAVAETASPLDTASADLAVLNRVSWGTETADAQRLASTGLPRYLEEQLNPSQDDGLPPDARNQIAAMEISQKPVVEIDGGNARPATGGASR